MSRSSEKFILPHLTGELGSRLFQIATALAYGERHKRTTMFHNSLTEEDSSCHVKDLFPYIEYSFDSLLLENPTTLPDSYPLRPTVAKVVVLDGDFQDQRYFEEKDVAISFPHPFSPIPELEHTSFLHIRVRGVAEEKQVKLTHYYMSALKRLPVDCPIMVFSDDIQWCRKNIPTSYPFIDISRWQWEPEGLSDVEALFLMSQCKRAAICANSAFSWWGAYLGCREVGSPVYMPVKWYLDKRPLHILPSWSKHLLC
jgi:hypothetical protein